MLFPFGYGLSYTDFTFSNLTVTSGATDLDVRIAFDVKNTGDRAGFAVPQVYVKFPPTAGEPPQQLKGFDRLLIPPNATRQVAVSLPIRAFEY
ncbi:MAG: fibronectin type III-like domain-contianing protein [Acidimicrobiales bacterium]